MVYAFLLVAKQSTFSRWVSAHYILCECKKKKKKKSGSGGAVVQSQCFCSRLNVAICSGIVDRRQINQKIKIKIWKPGVKKKEGERERQKMSGERRKEIPAWHRWLRTQAVNQRESCEIWAGRGVR